MPKRRSGIFLIVLAAVAFALIIHTREHRTRKTGQPAAVARIPRRPNEHEPPAPVTAGPNVRGAAQRGYSESEYVLLRQRYRSNMSQAYGPPAASRLKLLADIMRHGARNGKLLPAMRDVIYGKATAVEDRLDTGLNPDATVFMLYPYNINFSLLDVAIKAGQRDVIKVLLAHGANVNPFVVSGPDGALEKVEAPLVIAAGDGEDDVIRLLLQHGADIHQRRGYSGNNDTALDAAVYTGDVPTVYLLLTHGADVNSTLGPGGMVPAVLRQPGLADDPRTVALRNLLIEYGAKMPSER